MKKTHTHERNVLDKMTVFHVRRRLSNWRGLAGTRRTVGSRSVEKGTGSTTTRCHSHLAAAEDKWGRSRMARQRRGDNQSARRVSETPDQLALPDEKERWVANSQGGVGAKAGGDVTVYYSPFFFFLFSELSFRLNFPPDRRHLATTFVNAFFKNADQSNCYGAREIPLCPFLSDRLDLS